MTFIDLDVRVKIQPLNIDSNFYILVLRIEHFHPVYFPGKQGMAYTYLLLWTKVKGWIFIEAKIFQAKEWSRGCLCGVASETTPEPEKSWLK